MKPADTDARPVRSSLLAMALSSTLLVTLTGPAGAADVSVVDDEVSVTRGESVDIDVLANDQIGRPDLQDPVSIVMTTVPDVGSAAVVPAEQVITGAGIGAAGFATGTAGDEELTLGDEDPAHSEDARVEGARVEGARVEGADDGSADDRGAGTSEVSPMASAAPPVIRYSPGSDAPIGTVTFGYAVRSGELELGAAEVIVSILNAAPVTVADLATVTSGRGDTVDIAVLANDTDADGGTLAVSSVADPPHGRVSLVGDVVTYNPVNDYIGDDRFSYWVIDGQGGSAEGVVDITVTDATSAMVPADDSVKAVAGRTKRIDVLANDDSGGRGPLEVVSVGSAASGAEVSVGSDGVTVAYRAKRSFVGSDSFTYGVRDRRGNEARATVVVKVAAAPPSINITVSGPLTRKAVPYSYRPGCPVPPSKLRRIRMNYRSFSGEVQRGTLIVRRKAVKDIKYVFRRAFDARFRIKKMKKIDVYYRDGRRSPTGSDRAAMKAGNTSAFNCRSVVGNPTKRSAHSYGIAIDINTFQNPYVVGSTFYPPGSGSYLKRVPCRKGMICPGGSVAAAMKARDWPWGARWSNPDYQHFSATGG